MDLHLAGQSVIVSGSSRGIGRAIARAFLENGARAVITGRSEVSLTDAVREFSNTFGSDKVLSFEGDLRDPGHVSSLVSITVEKWGRIHCLVANVGSGTGRPGWEIATEEWDTLFQTNLWSGLRLVEAVLPHMVEARSGSVVLIASIAGLETLGAPLPYSVAKAALINYGKNLARQMGPLGIRVNSVAPGNILFPGGTWEKKLAEKREFFHNYIATEVPLQRFGTPEEIADLVVFLSSERASFITGACIVADGGQTRGI